MKKPEELNDLLTELREEIDRPSASYETESKVVVWIGRGQLNLTAQEAVFFLHSPDTVARFYEAIGAPDDCGIEIHGFDLDDEVKSALDATFSTVDEL